MSIFKTKDNKDYVGELYGYLKSIDKEYELCISTNIVKGEQSTDSLYEFGREHIEVGIKKNDTYKVISNLQTWRMWAMSPPCSSDVQQACKTVLSLLKNSVKMQSSKLAIDALPGEWT